MIRDNQSIQRDEIFVLILEILKCRLDVSSLDQVGLDNGPVTILENNAEVSRTEVTRSGEKSLCELVGRLPNAGAEGALNTTARGIPLMKGKMKVDASIFGRDWFLPIICKISVHRCWEWTEDLVKSLLEGSPKKRVGISSSEKASKEKREQA